MKPKKISKIVKIVFLGDSITSGERIEAAKNWVSLLRNYFFSKYYRQDRDIYVLNKGISVNNTRDGLQRFQNDVQNERPDILVIQFGLIDSTRWLSNRGLPCVSPEAFEANIIEMIARAGCFGINNIILLTTHRTHRDNVSANGLTQNQNLNLYNEIIRQISKQESIELIDMWEMINSDKVNDYVFSLPDGNHLTEEGHKAYYRIVLPVIEEIVNRIFAERGE